MQDVLVITLLILVISGLVGLRKVEIGEKLEALAVLFAFLSLAVIWVIYIFDDL